MKYFTQCKNLEELKKEFRRLAMIHHPDRGGDVADPWYSERFDVAYRDIYESCTALLDAILKQDKQ